MDFNIDSDPRQSTDMDKDTVMFEYLSELNLSDIKVDEPVRLTTHSNYFKFGTEKQLAYFPPSQQLLDKTPPKPTKKDPDQHVLPRFKGQGSRSCIIFLTATALLQYQQLSEKEDGRGCIQKMSQKTSLIPSSSQKNRKHIFKEPLSLVDFRPLMAPFVPELMRLLVNSIEKYCSYSSWNIVFQSHGLLHDEACRTLLTLLRVWYDKSAMRRIIKQLTPAMRVVVLRLFLNELDRKPLHFKRVHLNEMSKIPLFDFFLRPHPGYRSIVKHAALSTSCMFVDTAAFLMIHLTHAWEKTANPGESKALLASIYGNLLIGFAEQPEFKGVEHHDGRTIESALFEVILETCDSHYWNHLTMLKVRAAFAETTEASQQQAKENARKYRDSHLLLQLSKKTVGTCDVGEDVDSDSMDLEKISNFHSFYQKIDGCETGANGKEEEEVQLEEQSPALSQSEEEVSVDEYHGNSGGSTRGMTYISLTVPPLLSFAEFQLISSHKFKLPSILSKRIKFRRTTDILKDLLRARVMTSRLPWREVKRRESSDILDKSTKE